MFYLIKDEQGLCSIIARDEEKDNIIMLLSACLRGRRKKEKNFTSKPVRELENKVYREVIKTSTGEEYFISECPTVSFKEYM